MKTHDFPDKERKEAQLLLMSGLEKIGSKSNLSTIMPTAVQMCPQTCNEHSRFGGQGESRQAITNSKDKINVVILTSELLGKERRPGT